MLKRPRDLKDALAPSYGNAAGHSGSLVPRNFLVIKKKKRFSLLNILIYNVLLICERPYLLNEVENPWLLAN